MLCVVPLLRALRERYPHARLALLASPVNVDAMRGNRYIDEVILYDKVRFLDHGRLHPAVLIRFVRALREQRYSMAIVPSTVSTSLTSDLLAYLSGAQCRIGAGSLNGEPNRAAFLFTVPVTLDWSSSPDRHQTLRNLDIASSLELGTPRLSLEINLSDAEIEWGAEFLSQLKHGKRYAIGYHPGAGKPPNRWPSERFAALINKLSIELDAAVLVTCGPMDNRQVEEVEHGLNVAYQVMRNQPIRLVASVLRHLELVVTNDTGIMHVAAAVGVPVLSLFGPTRPEQWAPLGTRHRCIRGEGGDITMISLEEVIDTARSMLCS